MANERLRALEDVEKEIATILQCAGNIVLELSKDKHNASLLDRQLVQFQGSVNRVESELSGQIRYLTQVREQVLMVQTQDGVASIEDISFKGDFFWGEISHISLVIFLQVATGQPHEGSTYSARKDCQMALNRAEYAKVKLGELGRTCEVMLEQQQQQQQQQQQT
uniref:Mediator of RNA polymerase II transcription subunit 11 n=1 Tax=Gasterosteus aculeatus aculeatus TaxID=481459 RepID=A0AAQ4QYS3_GASAC